MPENQTMSYALFDDSQSVFQSSKLLVKRVIENIPDDHRLKLNLFISSISRNQNPTSNHGKCCESYKVENANK
ncbi:unnamed protein product [Heterobilharzia americana]|nr:unnamed protein product [Heterobilharzia americana]